MTNTNGSINFDETEFQQLFELYWDAAEDSVERSFVIEELQKYTYFYATSRYPAEFDTGSDFFLENIANTKKWLEEYDPSYHIPFLLFYTSKIKRRLFNFRAKVGKLKRYENLNEFYDLDPDTFIESVFEERKTYFIEDSESLENKKIDLQYLANNGLGVLKEDEEIAIKLYYGFELAFKDFRYFTRRLGRKKFFENFRKYRVFLNDRLRSEKESRETISQKLYLTSINLREVSNQKILDRRQRLLACFDDVRNLVPLRLIADIFQTNITNVQRKVKRGQKKLKNLLSDQLYFNFEDQGLRLIRNDKKVKMDHKNDQDRRADQNLRDKEAA